MNGPAQLPTFDRVAAGAHLERITGRWAELGEPAWLNIRAIGEHRHTQNAFFRPTDIAGALDWCAALNRTHNLYAVVNPVRDDVDRSGGKGASDSDVIAATWCWIDCDDAAAADRARAFEGHAHSFAVITGTEPHKRPHVYWELFDWQRDLAAWRDLQERLAAHFGSDPEVVNFSRIMRLAGTVTYPDAKKRARGYVSELTQWKPKSGAAAVAFDIMSGSIPEAPGRPSARGFKIDTGHGPAIDRDERIRKILAGEDWHNNARDVVASYVARKLSDSEIHAITDAWTLPPFGIEDTRRDVQKLIETARAKGFDKAEAGPQAGAQAGPLPLIGFSEASAPYLDDAWLIDDVLPLEGLGVLFGAPGSRKTFLAIDWALHIATGRRWRGAAIERRAVVYLSLEGGKPFANRLHAWAKHNGITPEDAAFRRCAVPLDLRSTVKDADRVIEAAGTIDMPVGLVVVDTLNRAMPGGNENAVEDMSKLIAHCTRIAEALRCFVLIVHHSGKDAAKGSRGHSSLFGAIDAEFQIAEGVVSVTKMRDGTDDARFGVGIEAVEIGTTPKGKRVFSCVAIEAEISGDKAWTPTGKAAVVWDALLEYAAEHGQRNPAGAGWPGPGTVRIVPSDAFRDFAKGRFTDSNPRRSFRDGMDKLQTEGFVAANAGFLWAIQGSGHGGQ